MLSLLAETPRRIAAATAGLRPGRLRVAPAPGEWSANDLLAHLRSCADVWGDAVATILAARGLITGGRRLGRGGVVVVRTAAADRDRACRDREKACEPCQACEAGDEPPEPHRHPR